MHLRAIILHIYDHEGHHLCQFNHSLPKSFVMIICSFLATKVNLECEMSKILRNILSDVGLFDRRETLNNARCCSHP